ncbi:hypothetical protein [Bifidobacterium canis]|uniref:Abortive infection phage resistance protein N-terminal domain-containing protein n=1 Tax=Bifidobacterium canis TaxID=2610880 RepID=A0A7K1J7B8_9BIFI|nr:hypothetical protein [Bifidobacterium canis]MUH60477.1 hypothetical protein [Bifidobacterium canis]
MESLEDYRHDLIEQVKNYGQEEELFDQDAFFDVACNILRDNEVIAEFMPSPYRHGEGTSHFMTVDGYDFSSYDQDESIVIIGCDGGYSLRQNQEMPTIQTSEYKKNLTGMRNFVLASLKGTVLSQMEESSEAYGLAQFIHEIKTTFVDSACTSSPIESLPDAMPQCSLCRIFILRQKGEGNQHRSTSMGFSTFT